VNKRYGLADDSDPKQGEAATKASIAVSRCRSLQNAFEPILHALLSVMDTPTVGLRQKALRGLGSIVTVDSNVLAIVSLGRIS
jgi:cohesin loading factor subunit SCC2